MMKTTFIYVLKCPTTGLIRYVGKSDNPSQRMNRHIVTAKMGETCHRSDWIRSLLLQNLKPMIEVVDEVPNEYWQACEAAYIEFFYEQGFDLTNGTDGGDGGPIMLGKNHPMFGKKHSAESILKIEEARAKQKNQPMLGRKHSKEVVMRLKISRANQTFSKVSFEKRGRTIRTTCAIRKVSGRLPKNCKISMIGGF